MQLLGKRVAELHRAFARTTGDPAFDPEPVSAADLAQWKASVLEEGERTFAAAAEARAVLSDAARALIDHGLSPATPMALIQQGTTPNQRVWTGTLSTLPLIIKNQAVRPPSLMIVGEVVKLHEKLAWFEPASSTG